MINYDLALKLKQAGFPQHKDMYDDCGYFCVHNDSFKGENRESVCAPTLSELIEELGDKFLLVEKLYPPDEAGKWWAKSNVIYECIGGSPEEAVANLYLALKKQ